MFGEVSRHAALYFLYKQISHILPAMNMLKPEYAHITIPASISTSEDGSSIGTLDQLSSSSGLTSSYQGSESDGSTSSYLGHERAPFEQRLHDIEQSIDRLYRLTVAIRRPSIINQNAKIASFVIRDDEGNNIDENFKEFALRFISHRFPKAATTLRERLAASVTLRRKRFLYRQSHQSKLSKKSYSVAPTLVIRSPSRVVISESTVVARTIVDNPIKDTHKTPDKVAKTVSQTSASKFSEKLKSKDIFELQTPTPRTSFSSNLLTVTADEIPRPPSLSPGSKEFECPYCCMMLPVTEAVQSNWT